jgi:hypothetical protein
VHIGTYGHEESLSRAGQLKNCRWSTVGDLLEIGDEGEGDTMLGNGIDTADVVNGVAVTVEFERGTYHALMLRVGDEDEDELAARDDEVHYPLLLVRMPAVLREMMLGYLSRMFDARVEMGKVKGKGIEVLLAGYMEKIGEVGVEVLEKVMKDVCFTLEFRGSPGEHLTRVEFTIRKEDLTGFLHNPPSTEEREQATAWSNMPRKWECFTPGPFLTGVREYLKEKTGMDMGHEDVFFGRVSCGAFVISREGKVKFFAPAAIEDAKIPIRKATIRLLEGLM